MDKFTRQHLLNYVAWQFSEADLQAEGDEFLAWVYDLDAEDLAFFCKYGWSAAVSAWRIA